MGGSGADRRASCCALCGGCPLCAQGASYRPAEIELWVVATRKRLVRDFLTGLVEESGRKRLARARLRRTFETGLVTVGDRSWSRDDLYAR